MTDGVRTQIDNILDNVKMAISNGNMDIREAMKALREFSSKANRDKVKTVLGVSKANDLFKEPDRATITFNLKSSLAENSKTYQRLAASQRMDDLTNRGAINAIRQGSVINPVKIAKSGWQTITRSTPELRQQAKDRTWGEVADFLTRPASQTLPQINSVLDYRAPEFNLSPKARRLIIQAARGTVNTVRDNFSDQ